MTEPVQINQQKFVCEKNVYIFITLGPLLILFFSKYQCIIGGCVYFINHTGVLLFICITIVILITCISLGKFYCNRSKRSNSVLSVERSEAVQSEYGKCMCQ